MVDIIINSLKSFFGFNVAVKDENRVESINVEEQKIQAENLQVEAMYTTLSEAKEEIWKRWNDKELRKKVEEYLGEIPEPFRKEPRVALSRSILSPNQELFYFLDLAKQSGLKPIGLEGIEDKFCTKNYDKVSLGKLSFLKCKNAEDGRSQVNVIDMVISDGKRFCDINTLWGENLVDFHHRMLSLYNIDIETFDDFKWFNHGKKKNSIIDYYKKIFTLFLCYGILFENFIAKGNEKQFTDGIVARSYREIEEIFGVKPLIVPLLPLKDEDHWYFRSYFVKK